MSEWPNLVQACDTIWTNHIYIFRDEEQLIVTSAEAIKSTAKSFPNWEKQQKVKVCIAVCGTPISQPRDVTQCYLPPDTSERAPP